MTSSLTTEKLKGKLKMISEVTNHGGVKICESPPRRYFSYKEYQEELLVLRNKTREDIEEIIAAPFTTINGIPNRREMTTSVFDWKGYRAKCELSNRQRWYNLPCNCNVVVCE